MSKHYLVFVQDRNVEFKCKKKLDWPSFTVDFGGHSIHYQLFMTIVGRDSVKREHVEEAHVYDTTMKNVTREKAQKIWLEKRKSRMDCEECDCMKRKTAYRIQMVLDASERLEARSLAPVEVDLKPKHLRFVRKLVLDDLDDLDEYLGYLSQEYSENLELVRRRTRYYFEHART